jgi:hypothetical protein
LNQHSNSTSFARLIQNCRKTRVAETLSRFYYDIDNEENGGEDDDGIHNPNFPYINKREMRFYFFNFGNELFENNLIQRLNEDNRKQRNSTQLLTKGGMNLN